MSRPLRRGDAGAKMSGSVGLLLRSTLNRWLVVIGCVVSLTAPLDLDTVAQMLDGSGPSPLPLAVVSNADNNDDDDNLVRPGRSPECRHDARKQTSLSGAIPHPEASFVSRCRHCPCPPCGL